MVGNLSKTSCALRKFCLKFGDYWLCRTPMKKARVVVFRFQAAKRTGGHALLAMQMGLMGAATHPMSLGNV